MMQTELRLFDLTVLIYKIGIKKIEFLASVYMFLCQIWKKKQVAYYYREGGW